MGILQLPTELRIQILEYLPDFAYGRNETIGPNVRLTPAICRVSQTLREEALPLYVKTSAFFIQTDEDLSNDRVAVWLQALGKEALTQVQELQLSRHWKIKQPVRWQGHVGFYVRLKLYDRVWQCNVGTYPIANDTRGVRQESVVLLHDIIMRRMRLLSASDEKGLSRLDVEFIAEAMNVVAFQAVSPFEVRQGETGRKRRGEILAHMKQELLALPTNGIEDGPAPFHMPY